MKLEFDLGVMNNKEQLTLLNLAKKYGIKTNTGSFEEFKKEIKAKAKNQLKTQDIAKFIQVMIDNKDEIKDPVKEIADLILNHSSKHISLLRNIDEYGLRKLEVHRSEIASIVLFKEGKSLFKQLADSGFVTRNADKIYVHGMLLGSYYLSKIEPELYLQSTVDSLDEAIMCMYYNQTPSNNVKQFISTIDSSIDYKQGSFRKHLKVAMENYKELSRVDYNEIIPTEARLKAFVKRIITTSITDHETCREICYLFADNEVVDEVIFEVKMEVK